MAQPKRDEHHDARSRSRRAAGPPPTVVDPAAEAEPWRLLQPSLAIQFTSAKRWEWSPDELGTDVKSDIISAIEAWQSAKQAFAKLQCALFDLVYAAKHDPSYAWLQLAAGTTGQEKRSAARAVALADGPLKSHAATILDVLQRLESCEAEFTAFLQGFLQVRETKSGEIWFHFQVNRHRQWLSTAEVRAQAAELCRFLSEAADTLARATQQLQSR